MQTTVLVINVFMFQNVPALPKKSKASSDMSAWLNVFAELDPLANPDNFGAAGGDGPKGEC